MVDGLASGMVRSTAAKWTLVGVWGALFVVLLYSLAVGARDLGSMLVYATLVLALITVLVQNRRTP